MTGKHCGQLYEAWQPGIAGITFTTGIEGRNFMSDRPSRQAGIAGRHCRYVWQAWQHVRQAFQECLAGIAIMDGNADMHYRHCMHCRQARKHCRQPS
jgi:hypothetical protein